MTIELIKYFIILFVSLIIYYIIPLKYRWTILLLCSFVYYYLLSSNLFIPILLSIISIYVGGLLLDKEKNKYNKDLEVEERKLLKKRIKRNKKIILFMILLFNIGLLVFFKYSNFLVSSVNSIFNSNIDLPFKTIILPLGISYYTLMAISYIVDVYRSKYDASKNPFKIALFLSFYPTITEGPIGRFDEVGEELYKGHKYDFYNIKVGLMLIVFGIFKKMVIADRAALLVNEVFGSSSKGFVVLLAIVLYTIQIYAEFSGFIDISIGSAKMLGIDLPINFKRPFFSKNVQEFWRRWHITLGAFLKDYIFYPISLSKITMKLSSIKNKYLSRFFMSAFPLLFVWFTCGIWHGASSKYILYGLYYYVIMMLELLFEPLFIKLYEKLKISVNNFFISFLRILKTWIFVFIGMTIFRAQSFKEAFVMIGNIFNKGKFNINSFGLCYLDYIIIIAFVIILFIIGYKEEKGINLLERINTGNMVKKYIVYFILFLMIVIFGIYGSGYKPSEFIYGQF